MDLASLKKYLASSSTPPGFRPASEDQVVASEQKLGFPIPGLLRDCYLQIGNGGFGPGYGLIGVEGGFVSDHGSLSEIYNLFRQTGEIERNGWREGMLPFCEWGCNIYTCLDCKDCRNLVYQYDEGFLKPHFFAIESFFDRWMSGVDILA